MEDVKYFFFSKEQFDKRVETERTIGRIFKPGTVLVRGTLKMFTEINNTSISTYPDAKLVIKGDINTLKYTDPSI